MNKKYPGLKCQILVGIIYILAFAVFICGFNETKKESTSCIRFELSFPSSVHKESITGRVYIIITKNNSREPRLQISPYGSPFFGLDVEGLKPEEVAVIDESVLGYPVESLNKIPPGEYYVQALINIYTQFHRSDGHIVWLPMDHWEGQRFNVSPGNLYSQVKEISIDPEKGGTIKLVAEKVIPPVDVPPDSEWVKRIKIQSKILTEFWGHPIYLGATILLPKGYKENPEQYYPAIYIQGHFSLRAPFGFIIEKRGDADWRRRHGYEFSKEWMSDDFPRMVAITFQHPTPYYDDSYAVNSENNGPYGDAIITELIPYIEKHFRIIPKPSARLLTGGSTGGWEALALQIFHPDFFGGCWALCPDPVDFRYFQTVNIYADKNAFYKEFGWRRVPTGSDRNIYGIMDLTVAQRNHYELVRGTKSRSGEQIDIFEATYGPVGDDGYPKPLFDPITGEIDTEVAGYWKEHFDLRYYLEKNWHTIGPKLVDKIHIYIGDMDTFYLNNAVYLMEEFLENRTNPHYGGTVEYGDRKPHCWGPYGVELIRIMDEFIKSISEQSK